jgi:hypothetical protein
MILEISKMGCDVKIDIGSGYNPAVGYKTLDSNYSSNYHDIEELPSVDVFRCRNVIHHIQNLNLFFKQLHEKLKNNGKIIIIEPIEEFYKQNLFLDNLWYRWINKRNDIYISNSYRDYLQIAKVFFKIKKTKIRKEKRWTILQKIYYNI